MRFDKEKLEALTSLPDDKLWAEVVRIAEGYGYSLPKATPSHSDMEKMRSVARADKINISEAMKLVNKYKNQR
ncbi:MAG: hypothetical protein J6V80_05135 [Clostridia bacterium]|nr:hypothetical protein [Clostridia bacterium]